MWRNYSWHGELNKVRLPLAVNCKSLQTTEERRCILGYPSGLLRDVAGRQDPEEDEATRRLAPLIWRNPLQAGLIKQI